MKRISIIVLLLVLFAFAFSANAQEGLTVTVPDNPSGGVGGLPIYTFWELVGVIITFFGGVVLTFVGLAQGIKVLRNDPVQMSIVEQAFKSVPSELVDVIQQSSKVVIEAAMMVKEMGEFFKEATDGVPVKDKVIDDPNAKG